MRKQAGIACTLIIFVVGLSERVRSYEVSTHAQMTSLALMRSQLGIDPAVLSGIGLDAIASAQFTYQGQPRTLDQMLQTGAQEEDDSLRPKNHFYDSQYQNRTGRGLTVVGAVGAPSPDWALEDRFTLDELPVPQSYSYRDGQEFFRLGLLHAQPGSRAALMSLAMLVLGHVVHHVQDMGQPEHVRNDAHFFLSDPSTYEAYVRDQIQGGTLNQIVAQAGYPIPSFASPRDYFYTAGASSPKYLGMAEFTSQNFVSKDTGFRILPNGSILSNALIPLPSGQNVDGSSKRIQPFTVDFVDRAGAPFQADVNIVVGKVYDEFTGSISAERKLAGTSLLNSGLKLIPSASQVTIRSRVSHPDEAAILLPRAVSFSAGMINNFFRVRIDLRRDAAGTNWVVDNVSGRALDGNIQILTETPAGVRTPWGAAFAVNLAAGQSITAPIAEPTGDPAKLVAVFSGRVGNELPPSQGGLTSVGGKVVPYSAPAIPCPSVFTNSGSSAGMSGLVDLGSAAGPYDIEFEAYGIPDGLVVKSGSSSGSTIATTNGLKSGFFAFNKTHAPAPGASTKVHVRVDGNSDTGTQWVVTVGCPNQPLSNSSRTAKRVQVTIGKEVTQGGGCEAGYANVLVDGVSAGTISYQSQVSNSVYTIVSTGPDHSVQFAKTVTSPSNPYSSCTGSGRFFYTDGSGVHYLSPQGGMFSVQ